MKLTQGLRSIIENPNSIIYFPKLEAGMKYKQPVYVWCDEHGEAIDEDERLVVLSNVLVELLDSHEQFEIRHLDKPEDNIISFQDYVQRYGKHIVK